MSAVAVIVRRSSREDDDRDVAYLLRKLEVHGTVNVGAVRVGAAVLVEAVDDVRGHPAVRLTADPDDDIVVAVDAHLTARAELRRELRALGHVHDSTTSDRDLVRSAYRAWGQGCVSHLNGEFVAIVWDARAEILFAAQDQFGSRELFWSASGDFVMASSRLSVVVGHPDVPRQLNERAIGAFLLLGRARPTEDATSSAAVHRLLRAHQLVSDRDSTRVMQYWEFPYSTPMSRRRHRRDYVEEFRELLGEVVADRLEDVPRAVVHLSGGLDSTSIATLAVEARASGRIDTDITAVSAGYCTLAPDTELYYAGLVARAIGIDQTVIIADDVRLREPLTMRAESLQDFAVGLTERIAEVSHRQAPLILSGKGGDEVLTETPLYHVLLQHDLGHAAKLYGYLWRMSGARPPLGGYRSYVRELVRPARRPTSVPERFPFPTWLTDEFVRRAGLDEMWADAWRVLPPERLHLTQPDIAEHIGHATWNARSELVPQRPVSLPDMTMPFTDLRLVRFLLALPPSPWNRRKQLPRDAMATTLPPEVLTRHKTPAPPFPITLLNQPEAAWADTWSATETLGRFVRRDAIPPVYRAATIERAVIDTRPLFLNEWLRVHGWE